MFYKSTILNVNNEEVLYLFLENSYEFALEFSKEKKCKNIQNQIKKFIKNNNIIYNGNRIFIVYQNIIIGSVLLSKNNDFELKKYTDVNSFISFEEPIEIIDISNDKNYPITVLLEDNTKKVVDINLYIKKILINKIPITYESEAIKSIAVVIRTNCLKDLEKYGYIKDYNNYYYTNIQKHLKNRKNLIKLEHIIESTQNIYLTFNKKISYLPEKFSTIKSIKISNYGMNLMAKAGYNFMDILTNFYPNTEIQNIQ